MASFHIKQLGIDTVIVAIEIFISGSAFCEQHSIVQIVVVANDPALYRA